MKGSFFSSSSANMIRGRQNASVLPDPVNAIPIMSLPENLYRIKFSGSHFTEDVTDKRTWHIRYRDALDLNRRRFDNAFRFEEVD